MQYPADSTIVAVSALMIIIAAVQTDAYLQQTPRTLQPRGVLAAAEVEQMKSHCAEHGLLPQEVAAQDKQPELIFELWKDLLAALLKPESERPGPDDVKMHPIVMYALYQRVQEHGLPCSGSSEQLWVSLNAACSCLDSAHDAAVMMVIQ